MNKEELKNLADKYRKKADTAFQNYQETGVTQYGSSFRRNEELADALRMAADAADEHFAYISLKGRYDELWKAFCQGSPLSREQKKI